MHTFLVAEKLGGASPGLGPSPSGELNHVIFGDFIVAKVVAGRAPQTMHTPQHPHVTSLLCRDNARSLFFPRTPSPPRPQPKNHAAARTPNKLACPIFNARWRHNDCSFTGL